MRALLTARKLIKGKLLDIECGKRGVLRGFGLKVGPISRGRFEARILELIDGHATLTTVIGVMLFPHRVAEGICASQASAIVAITFKSGVDDPMRFKRSRDLDPHFDLRPKKYQSGEVDVPGRVTKVAERMVLTALYEAASVMLTRTVRFSSLKAWGMAVAKRRGSRKARVPLARKLGVILHRMWIDGTSFRWSNQETTIA